MNYDGILSLALLATTSVLLVVQRRMVRSATLVTALIAVLGALLIWLPQLWRDVALCVIIALLAALLADGTPQKLLWAALSGGVAAGVAYFLPGGITPVLLGVAATWAYFAAKAAIGHLMRLGRAAKLLPHDRPAGEVEVGGKLSPEAIALPEGAGIETPVGAWQLHSIVHGVRGARPQMLTLHAREGVVRVDLEQVMLQVDDDRRKLLSSEAAAQALRAVGIEEKARKKVLADGSDIGQPYVYMSWLPPGHDVYVVGVPSWEPGAGAAYRDAPVVPVFRDGEKKAHLVDRSDLEERRRAHWTLWQWVAWGAIGVCIAARQLFL